MSVGTSIILSAALIAFVLLFNFTKDRWNWKKILLIWPLKTVLVIGVVGGLGYLIYDQHQNRLQIAEQYGGVKLSSSLDDVFFLLGNEFKTMVYDESKESVYLDYRDSGLIITIKDKKVWRVRCDKDCYSINGISLGASMEELEARYGETDLSFESIDKLSRLYAYKKHKTFYVLEKNKVIRLGIIELDLGMPGESKDESEKYEFMDSRQITDKKTILIRHIPIITGLSHKAYWNVTADVNEMMSRIIRDSKDGDEVIYDEFVKKEEERIAKEKEEYKEIVKKQQIAEEKRKAEAAERKRKEGARQKEKAENKKAEKVNSISQIKLGMADWQVEKILGYPLKKEGKSSCRYGGEISVWYYSEKRKEGPYVTFTCSYSLKTFEVNKIKTY